jgi:hypothetical protein
MQDREAADELFALAKLSAEHQQQQEKQEEQEQENRLHRVIDISAHKHARTHARSLLAQMDPGTLHKDHSTRCAAPPCTDHCRCHRCRGRGSAWCGGRQGDQGGGPGSRAQQGPGSRVQAQALVEELMKVFQMVVNWGPVLPIPYLLTPR